jgi:hypothetical protein
VAGKNEMTRSGAETNGCTHLTDNPKEKLRLNTVFPVTNFGLPG